VTDADLLLGRLPAELASGLELDAAAAERALGDVDASDAVLSVNAEMLRAVRLVSIERGHDPRDFALVAFGGAGPLHACELADELGIATVLVPAAAGVLSALGLVASEERRDHVRSHVCPLADAGELPAEGEADLRYRGQSFELTIPLGPDLAARFHRAHEERYGYADQDRPLELVSVRTAEVRPAPTVALPGGDESGVDAPAAGGSAEGGRAGEGRGVGSSGSIRGPARVELDGSTAWLPPGWVGVRDGPIFRLTRL
jgi:N-methylhydantoinase A